MGCTCVYKDDDSKRKENPGPCISFTEIVRRIQRFYPVSIATLSRLMKGVLPQSAAIRCRLGLTTLPFEKRLAGHRDKESILAIYEVLKNKDAALDSRQISLFP